MPGESFINIGTDVYEKIMPFTTAGKSLFSFRNKDVGSSASKFKINIYPQSLNDYLIKDMSNDISFRQNKQFSEIIDSIPAIQVREYVQSPKLQQITNAFSAFVRGWDIMMEMKDSGEWDSLKGEIGKIVEHITSIKGLSEFFSKLNNKYAKTLNGNKEFTNIIEDVKNKTYINYVLKLPFFLQYRLMTTISHHIYILPYGGNFIDKSDGSVGWNTAHGAEGFGTSKDSIFGIIANFIGNNIRINTTPTWDGTNDINSTEIQIKFNLFNDTYTAAVNNFLFVNTIIPMNKYLQYHIYQHNPAVYDIKLEGVGRWYMCSGNIQCNSVGNMRYPSKFFMDKLTNYISPTYKKDQLVYRLNNLIKIPDSYEITITFKSLLPNSLNSYLYNYSGNENMSLENLSDFNQTNPINNFDGVCKEYIDEVIKNVGATNVANILSSGSKS